MGIRLYARDRWRQIAPSIPTLRTRNPVISTPNRRLRVGEGRGRKGGTGRFVHSFLTTVAFLNSLSLHSALDVIGRGTELSQTTDSQYGARTQPAVYSADTGQH